MSCVVIVREKLKNEIRLQVTWKPANSEKGAQINDNLQTRLLNQNKCNTRSESKSLQHHSQLVT